MLYVSRSLGMNKWCVYDTDDDTEEQTTSQKIQDALLSGVEIKGAKLVNNAGSMIQSRVSVNVYVPEGMGSSASVKAATLLGLNIPVRNGEILGVGWNPYAVKDGQRIRLSVYGNKCSNFIFTRTIGTTVKAVIVFDDKVAVKRYTFKDAFRMSALTIDIREVSSDKVAKYLYDEYFLNYRGVWKNVRNRILDTEDRYAVFECLAAVYTSDISRYLSSRARHEVHSVIDKVAEFLNPVFKRVCTMKLKLGSEDGQVKVYYGHLKWDEDFWRSKSGDYGDVIDRDFYEHGPDGILESMIFARDCLESNYYDVNHFYQFMRLPFVPEYVQKMYVSFVYRLTNWLLDLGRDKGW